MDKKYKYTAKACRIFTQDPTSKNLKRILFKQRNSVLSFLNPGFSQSPLIQTSGRCLHS